MYCLRRDVRSAVFSSVGCAALQGSFSNGDASLVNNLSENLSDRILAEGQAALIFASLPYRKVWNLFALNKRLWLKWVSV